MGSISRQINQNVNAIGLNPLRCCQGRLARQVHKMVTPLADALSPLILSWHQAVGKDFKLRALMILKHLMNQRPHCMTPKVR